MKFGSARGRGRGHGGAAPRVVFQGVILAAAVGRAVGNTPCPTEDDGYIYVKHANGDDV